MIYVITYVLQMCVCVCVCVCNSDVWCHTGGNYLKFDNIAGLNILIHPL